MKQEVSVVWERHWQESYHCLRMRGYNSVVLSKEPPSKKLTSRSSSNGNLNFANSYDDMAQSDIKHKVLRSKNIVAN